MRLLSIFSSNALFQQNSTISFKGYSEKGRTVSGKIMLGDEIISRGEAVCGDDGMFSVDIATPCGSFTPYEIEFTDGNDEQKLENVLFGEVWLAAGQSNMELPNEAIENHGMMYERMKKHKIRFYYISDKKMEAETYAGEPYPFEPCIKSGGIWSTEADDRYYRASACASEAVVKLAERFEEEEQNMPVGFVDISYGGTTMESWLPLEYCEGELKDALIAIGRYSAPENRNKVAPTGYFFHQMSIMYNLLVYPVHGIKARGLIWYQGESNSRFGHAVADSYKKLLLKYYEVYKGFFACSGKFTMICSLLYPFLYGLDAGVRKGNVDLGMMRAAKENENISVFPIHHLNATWSYFYGNHAIHPTNKYAVGDYFASLMLTNAYGEKGMRTAAYLKKMQYRRGGFIDLHFETFGKAVTCRGDEIRGIYIAGKNGTYIPADAEIVSKTTVRVSSKYIKNPKHVCYQIADLEADGNLFCGGYGVAPFATDEESDLSVTYLPWVNPDVQSIFYRINPKQDAMFFCYPIRHSIGDGTEFCYDSGYNVVRMINTSGNDTLGIYFSTIQAAPINLHLFKEMRFDVYCRPEVKLELCVTFSDGEGRHSEKKIPVVFTYEDGTGVLNCTARLNVKPCINVEKLAVLCDTSGLLYKSVGIGRIDFVPKA